MEIVCLDLEGVLVPEIWIAFAEETGIPELKKTTRDEPDYDKLMKYRLNILKEHNLGLKEIQETIAKIDPLPGAKEFLDKLRELTQVIIISDTFSQFAGPLMKKLGYPTIFCNSLVVADNGEIVDFKMRCEKSKYTTVKALQSIGYDTIASGDSHNDLGMIQASKAGFLFRSTDAIKAEYPQFPAFETYDERYDAIKKVIEGEGGGLCKCANEQIPRRARKSAFPGIVHFAHCQKLLACQGCLNGSFFLAKIQRYVFPVFIFLLFQNTTPYDCSVRCTPTIFSTLRFGRC